MSRCGANAPISGLARSCLLWYFLTRKQVAATMDSFQSYSKTVRLNLRSPSGRTHGHFYLYCNVQGQTHTLTCVLAWPRPSRLLRTVGKRQQPSAQLGHSGIPSTVSAGSLQPLVWFMCVCTCISLSAVCDLRHFTVWLCFLKHSF